MTTSNIMIICLFFGASFLLMLPFYFWNKGVKKKAANFASKNKNRAVVHLFGEKTRINGRKVKDYDHGKGESLETVVALEPGKYVISSKYKTTDSTLTGNHNYETPGMVDMEVELEKGMEYTVGLFFEHPYELEFDGVTEVVTAIPLKVPGLLAKHKVINVICFRDGKVMSGPALTGERLKKVAVSALYGMQQSASLDTLSTGLGKYKKKTILEDWWGITQSDYAVETLERLVYYIKTTEQLFAEQSPEVVSQVLLNDKLMTQDIATMEELRKNSVWKHYVNVLKKGHVITSEEEVLKYTPLAWDMGRLVFMSRLCFDAGYISEEDAWTYIDTACERLRFFDSWSSFTTSYLIGRTMWDVEHPFIQDFRKFEKELLQPGNLWNKTAI